MKELSPGETNAPVGGVVSTTKDPTTWPTFPARSATLTRRAWVPSGRGAGAPATEPAATAKLAVTSAPSRNTFTVPVSTPETASL
jgi:hypothetical protein